MADVKIASKYTTAPASQTSQDVTITGLGTPVGLLLSGAYSSAGDGVGQTNARISLGAYDGTTQGYVGTTLSDTLTNHTGETGFAYERLHPVTQASNRIATATSLIADGVTLSWTGTSSAADPTIALFFSGTDIDCEVVTVTENPIVDDFTDVTVSQRPNLVIATTTNDDLAGSGPHNGFGSRTVYFIKISADGTVIDYAGVSQSFRDNGTTETLGIVSTTSIKTIDPSQDNTNFDGDFLLSSPVATTLRLTTVAKTADASPASFILQCFNIGVDFDIGVFDTPTATGEQFLNLGLAYKPQALVTLTSFLSTVNTFTTGGEAGAAGISIATDPNELAAGASSNHMSMRYEHGVATNQPYAYATQHLFKQVNHDQTETIEATLTSFATGGANINPSSVSSTARKWVFLSIATDAVSQFTLSPAVADSLSEALAPSLLFTSSFTLTPAVADSLSEALAPSLLFTSSFTLTPAVADSLSEALAPSLLFTSQFTLSPVVADSLSEALVPSLLFTSQFTLSPVVADSLSEALVPSLLFTSQFTLSPVVADSLSEALAPSLLFTSQFTLSPAVADSLSEALAPSLLFTSQFTLSPVVADSLSEALVPSLLFGVRVEIFKYTVSYEPSPYFVKYED